MKLDKLITYEELTGTDDLVSVVTLPLSELHTFSKHPFRVIPDDDAMAAMIDSIRERGVLNPVLVRPASDGYEIISGHRRTFAAQAAGLMMMKLPA